MNLIASTGAYAVFPYYHARKGCHHGETIAEVLRDAGDYSLDSTGIRGYLDKAPDTSRTCFREVRKLPPHHALLESACGLRMKNRAIGKSRSTDLFELLRSAIAEQVPRHRKCALALSGGLDSAIVLAFTKNVLNLDIPVFTVATDMQDYCELEATRRTARHFGVDLTVLHASEADFIDMLPDVIGSAEVPLYNLHPVSKMILCRKVREKGFDCVLTGDAADQAFAGAPAGNYLPIVGAIMRHEKMGYFSPFFDEHVVAYGQTVTDSNKTALRELAKTLVPDFLLNQPKTPRLAPAMDISRYWDAKCIERICETTNLECKMDDAGQRTLWTTLGLLVNGLRKKI
jgi:asparagine synthase (glutamine-hydrolysing)